MSVRMPSTSSTAASPIMAKSWKSTCMRSLKRWRSGPSTGGMGRLRTALARSRNRSVNAGRSNESDMEGDASGRPLDVRQSNALWTTGGTVVTIGTFGANVGVDGGQRVRCTSDTTKTVCAHCRRES